MFFNQMKRNFQFGVLVATCFLFFSCKNDQSKIITSDTVKTESIHLINIKSPTNGAIFTKGDKVTLQLKFYSDTIKTDSIQIYVNEKYKGKVGILEFAINTDELLLGNQNIRATAWKNGNRQSSSINIKLKTNVKPKKYGYRVIKIYPHDVDAYTQGLFYYQGYLYEGTGQNGSSSLRKVELESGKIIQSLNLDYTFFGEGIALLNDKIYQITWTSEKGFVYDLKTFNKIGSFDFSTQGWGLTTNGKELIMSDGSNLIHFMEPERFLEVGKIEVYDNQGPVNQLNELELINGELFANVYQTDNVVIIDPQTGTVKGIIDFYGLLKPSERTRETDVLNGIAWDAEGKRLFVTGKKWPKLFQVELVEKK